MQKLFVYIVVLAAAIYIIRVFRGYSRTLKKKDGGGCGSCGCGSGETKVEE